MKRLVRSFIVPLLCGVILVSVGCEKTQEKNSAVGFYMDTVVTLTGYCGEDLLKDALKLCGEYEKMLSRTVEGSDIWNINHSNGSEVKVSAETAELLALALDICEKSGGALDISIAPAVELWNFKSDSAAIPDSGALAAAMQNVDHTKIRLENDTVSLPDGMSIDLGAVAKGYIADRVAEFLRDEGVESAVLNFGGNVITIGNKPDGSLWTIGVQDPAEPTGEYGLLLAVENSSVVTSGTYQRYFDVDGIRYHHILDTSTGYPVSNGVASVTVIAESSALCDALSTSCFAMGREGLEFAKSLGAEAIMIFDDGTAEYTDGAKELIINREF